MFKKIVNETPFTKGEADEFSGRIRGGDYKNDVSFLSTLRALVASRLPEDEELRLDFVNHGFPNSIADISDPSRVIQRIFSVTRSQFNAYISVFNVRAGSHEETLAALDLIETNFANVYPDWRLLKKIGDFYVKSFKVVCFINPKIKSVALFVDNLDIRKMHYLQVSIPAFLPWYFDPSKGMSDLEMALLYSLREKDAEKYEQCLSMIAIAYDFRAAKIRKLLYGFETRFYRADLEDIKEQIADADRGIHDYNDHIRSLLRTRDDLCIRMMGLEQKIQSDGGSKSSEIMEYFIRNKNISLQRVTDIDVDFCVRDYLLYFDPDTTERTIQNTNSVLYRCLTENKKETAKRLYTELFLTDHPRLRIRFCAAYRFNLRSGVIPRTDYHFPEGFETYMPNTHINEYGCMGNYLPTINTLLEKHDYVSALEQCVASNRSLNFADSTVVNRFARSLWEDDSNRCIELPNGNIVNANEAADWLGAQDAPAAESEEQNREG